MKTRTCFEVVSVDLEFKQEFESLLMEGMSLRIEDELVFTCSFINRRSSALIKIITVLCNTTNNTIHVAVSTVSIFRVSSSVQFT